MKTVGGILLFLLITSQVFGQQSLTAQDIVDRCIKVHGGKKYEKSHFIYDFRDKRYTYTYDKGKFEFTRSFSDTSGIDIKDIMTNEKFERLENGKTVSLDEKKSTSYANALNSVNYFAFLPFRLNDPAVNKKLLGEIDILGSSYYKIEITFDQQGGGDDYDDIHIYWINKESFTMDYMAYSFEVNGGGVRFRKAYNVRHVGGVRFQDYVNYKHHKNTPVTQMDILFEQGKLEELSRIELKEIKTN